MLSHFGHVPLFVTSWTVSLQAPLSTGFSRQEHWSGLPFPPPGVYMHTCIWGFPGGANSKEHSCQCRWHGFSPWMGKIPWRSAWPIVHGVTKSRTWLKHLADKHTRLSPPSLASLPPHPNPTPLFPSSRGLPNPGIKPGSPALQVKPSASEPLREAPSHSSRSSQSTELSPPCYTAASPSSLFCTW